MPDQPYPNQHWGPRPSEENTIWEDANGRQMHIPYRGSEQHGVPHMVAYDAVEHDKVAETAPFEETGQVVIDPVPVVIVDKPMMAIENKVSPQQYNLVQNGEPVQVCARRLERHKAHFSASSGSLILLGPNPTQAKMQGFPVPTGSSLGWITNQPVWAYTTTANATLFVAEEYQVKAGEKIT